MANQLTRGAIKCIFESSEIKQPVVQVINIKKIAGQSSSPERFRLIISDGEHYMQAMLATQMNDKVNSGQIGRNCLIVLDKFICNTVQTRRIAIILNAETLPSNVTEKIGTPFNIEPSAGASNVTGSESGSLQPPMPQQLQQQQQQQIQQQQQQPKLPQQQIQQSPQQQYRPQPPASIPTQNANHYQGGGGESVGVGGGYGQQNNPGGQGFRQQPPQPQRHAYGGNAPTTAVYPIKGLSPYQSKWTIKARVTLKSDIKEYSNARGAGKLFSVNLLDESGEIKATGFNEAVDSFYNLLEENKVYYISGAKVNMARKQFSTIQNDYELGFERNTEIIPCTDSSNVPTLQYKFVPLNQLDSCEKDSMIDVLGVVKEVQDVSEIISKTTQKPIKKRELTLVDSTQFSVRLTLWGKQAEAFVCGHESPVVACKSVKVGDFGGRSLSMFSGSAMTINPDVPEAHTLRGWFDSQGQGASFKSHSTGGMGAGGMRPDERKTFAEVKDLALGEGDKPDYFTAKGTIVFFKQDNISYPACPSDNCNKKVTEDNGQWRCERCQRAFPAPDHRYIMGINVSDHTGQVWLQCFNEIGELLIGRSAGELNELKVDNEQEYNNVFLAANFKSYLFKCRAKSEVFNDQSRVRYSVLSASPVDWAEQANWLIQQIQQYK